MSGSPAKPGILLRAYAALLRIAYYLLYNELAFTYDAVAWLVSFGEWAAWRRSVIPFLAPGEVLEIAHGTGTLSLDLSDAGFQVTALDISPAMGRIAAAKKKAWSRRGGIRTAPALVRADVMRLPFGPRSFRNAVSTFPADFILDPRTACEVYRTLKPGGLWAIVPTAWPEFVSSILSRSAPRLSAMGSKYFHLEQAGFRTRMEIIRRPRSRVVVIIAERQETTDDTDEKRMTRK